MTTTPPPPPYDFAQNKNNPTKEILASSGIWEEKPYALTLFASDIPNVLVPNTGINSTTTTTAAPSTSGSIPYLGISTISSGNYYIDNMLIFNSYHHYDTKNQLRKFDPQTFLQQSIKFFNIYG